MPRMQRRRSRSLWTRPARPCTRSSGRRDRVCHGVALGWRAEQWEVDEMELTRSSLSSAAASKATGVVSSGQQESRKCSTRPRPGFAIFLLVLDRDGNGSISTAEFFALAIFESCESAGYEAGITTLLQLYPQLFRQGPVDRQAFIELLLSLGFNHSPDRVVDDILKQAMECNWKRVADTSSGKLIKATGEDLLAWFRELIRPSSSPRGAS